MRIPSIIRRNALFGLLLFGMFGGLMSAAFSATSQPPSTVSQVGATPGKTTAAQTDQVNDISAEPAQTVTTLPETVSPTATQAVKIACDEAAKASAIRSYHLAWATEKTRHDHAVMTLHTTGLVTRLLNPSDYVARIDQENDVHAKIVNAFTRVYENRLASAHCS